MGQARHVFIVNDFPPVIGGQSSYLYYLCRALPPERILVLAPSCGDTSAFDQSQPFKIIRKPYLTRLPLVEKVFKTVLPLFYLRTVLRGEKIALLHCAHVLSTGCIGLVMKALWKVDYVVYTHGADVLEYWQHPLLRPLLKKILEEARHVVANSRYTRARLECLGVVPAKVIVSSPRVDAMDFGKPCDPARLMALYHLTGRRIVLSVNRLVPRKGNDTVIRAMPEILKRFPGAVYLVYGDGPCRGMLKVLVEEMGLQGAVVFMDRENGDIRRELMAACDVFVMVSRTIEATGDVEGFGVVYLEAGAAGKAVVAGNSGGVPDAVEDGVNGFLVDPSDEGAVADAVSRLLADPALAARLGAQGRARVQEKFDYRRGVPELEEVFK